MFVFVKRGSKGGAAKRPVDGLPAPGSAAARLRRAKRKQPAGEAESPSIPTKQKAAHRVAFLFVFVKRGSKLRQ